MFYFFKCFMFFIHRGSSTFSNYDHFVKRSIKHNRVLFQLFIELVTLKLLIRKIILKLMYFQTCLACFLQNTNADNFILFFSYSDHHCSVTNILQNIRILYHWVKYFFNSGVYLTLSHDQFVHIFRIRMSFIARYVYTYKEFVFVTEATAMQ